MSDPLPLISIFTVVKNGAKTIRRCLDSVLALDYPNFEHVIQDGASTDGTLEILQEYARKYPGVIKLVSEPDSCAEEGFFRSLQRCAGVWIGGCLADEALLPQAGKWAAAAFEQHPLAGAIYGDLCLTDGNGQIQSEFKPHHPFTLEKYLLHELVPPFAATFFSGQALADIDIKSHAWVHGVGEFELWVRLGSRHPVHYMPGLVATYGVHSGQRSRNSRILLELAETRDAFLKRLFGEPEFEQRFAPIFPQVMGGMYLWASGMLRETGCYAEAAELLLKAVPYRPNAEPFKQALHHFFNEGTTLVGQKRPADAILCWEPLVELGIEIPQLADLKRQVNQSREIADLLAQSREHVAQENWKEAAAICAKAVEVAPEETENLHIFAHALANLGLLAESLHVARRLVSLNPAEEFTSLVSALEGAIAQAQCEPPMANSGATLHSSDAALAIETDLLPGRPGLISTEDPVLSAAAHCDRSS